MLLHGKCTFEYGNINGGKEVSLGKTDTEEECNEKAKQKIPMGAKGAKWVVDSHKCAAEFNKQKKPIYGIIGK